MTIKRAIQTTGILGGSRHDVDGQQFAFLDFAQPAPGSAPHSIAVPLSEMDKLAQVAMQAVPSDQRHQLLAGLTAILENPPPSVGETYMVKAFGVDDWIVGHGEDGSIILTLRLEPNGGNLSFRLEKREARQLSGMLRTILSRDAAQSASPSPRPSHPFLPIAEDIEWLRDEWVGGYRTPSSAELRRASGTLRQLLINGALNQAWRYCGLEGGPHIVAPNLHALMSALGHDPKYAAITLAGGIEINGVSCACMVLRKTLNTTRGIGPDADEGFAVEVGCLMKRVVEGATETDDARFAAVQYTWKSVERYMAAPSAIRRGMTVSRKSVLEYFAHYSGGVHLDRVKNNPKTAAAFALHEELDGRADVMGVDGLYAELLAMGQAIGRSPDMLRLAKVIREAAERDAQPFSGVGLEIRARPP